MLTLLTLGRMGRAGETALHVDLTLAVNCVRDSGYCGVHRGGGTMLMRFAIAAVAAIVGLVSAGLAGATKPNYGCPPGFDLGAYTFSDYLQLPRTQAAIEAGLIDGAFVLAGLSSIDRNANGVVCVQLSQGYEVSSKPFGQYMYNVVDDNASTP
jgi:hypothetical protein